MFGDIVPEDSSSGIIDCGDSPFKRQFVGDGAVSIIGTLFTAIADGPRLLVVVGGSRSGRLEVAVAGNFSAVVEVVEHAELQGQFVLVRSDVGSVHGERGVAVADRQIAEDLIVGTIF